MKIAVTIADLTAEYRAKLRQHGLEPLSADELLSELCTERPADRDDETKHLIAWVSDFLVRWNSALDA